jgi:hypothetical protein
VPPALESVIEKALSKSPLDRYSTCGEFLAAARTAAAERHIDRSRLAVSVTLLLLAAALGAGAALGLHALLAGGGTETVTTTVAQQATAPSLEKLLLQSQDGRTLNDAAFALINAHEYARALPLARKAAQVAVKGTPTRGYATFNYGFALLHLGRCRASLPQLELALKIEAHSQRRFIVPEIRRARACARGTASAPAP